MKCIMFNIRYEFLRQHDLLIIIKMYKITYEQEKFES